MIVNWKILLIIIWLATAIFDYAKYSYVWQLKEYRWRNMLDYLRKNSNRQLVFNSFYFLHRILRPQLTLKIILINVSSFLLETVVIYFLFSWLTVFIIIILRFFIFSGVVGLFYMPTILIKKIYIYRATKKLKGYHGKLKVVGVTGSYGKTTVKYFLDQVLSSKFKVLKSPKYVNTEIGIARFILQTNFSKVEIFIVEMGAYKPGDIEIITKMVKPIVGILTSINEQHLALFDNLKTTQATKYELLYSLPKNGLAIVNNDNKLCREFLDKIDVKSKTFGTNGNLKPDYYVSNITMNEQGIVFNCNDVKYMAPIIGKHNAINLVPVIIAADYFGMKQEEIQNAIQVVKLPPQNTQLYKLNRALIIDDSHNANPNGFMASLELLNFFKKNRRAVVITRGMNELGKSSRKNHYLVANNIAKVADTLVIISPDNKDYLKKGIGNRNTKIEMIFSGEKLIQYIKKISSNDAVILLENRLFSNVDEYLKNNRENI